MKIYIIKSEKAMTAEKNNYIRRITRYAAVLDNDGLKKLVIYAATLYRNQYQKEKKQK